MKCPNAARRAVAYPPSEHLRIIEVDRVVDNNRH